MTAVPDVMQVAPLSKRFATTGRLAYPINELRLEARDRLAAKLAAGVYRTVVTACPVCETDGGTMVSLTDTYGLPYEVAVCGQCELVYARRRLDARSSVEFYNQEYRPLDRGRAHAHPEYFERQYGKYELIRDSLAAASAPLPVGSLVMEIGCGAGGTLAAFRDHGYRIVGFDPGCEYVAFGRDHDLNLLEGGIADADEWVKREGERPQLVIYEQVLEHVDDPVGELKAVRRVMEPASVLFVGVPGLRNIDAHYESDFLRYLQFPHLVHFDLASLRRVAVLSGFRTLAGNERIHAVLAPANGEALVDQQPPTSAGTLRFLKALERRWRRRQRLEYLGHLPRRVWNRGMRTWRSTHTTSGS